MNKRMIHAGARQGKLELYRFAFVCLMAALFMLVFVEPIERLLDQHVRERPFVRATVELIPNAGGKPSVLYRASAEKHTPARWSAWVSVNGARVCGASGQSGYGPAASEPALWNWESWLGVNCPEPRVPYSLCVRYFATTPTGINDTSPPVCTETYDPRQRP